MDIYVALTINALSWLKKKEVRQMAKCNEKTEVYSRIVGYLRPVRSWNSGKAEEFGERKTFSEKKALSKEV